MAKIQAPVIHLTLTGKGIQPQIPTPYTLRSGDVGFDDNIHLMVSQWAFNADDNLWFYRGRDRLYALNFPVKDITSGTVSGGIEIYNPLKPYLAGETYVTYVSPNVGFRREAIYRCDDDAAIGESPELNPGKWEKQSEDFQMPQLTISSILNLQATLDAIALRIDGIKTSYLGRVTITTNPQVVTIPAQVSADYFVTKLQYLDLDSADSLAMVFIDNTSNTTTQFTVYCDDSVLGGELIFNAKLFD